MEKKRFVRHVLKPGYAIILAGSILDNIFYNTNWFLLGSLIGFVWLCLGLAGIFLSLKELKKGEGFMLVQSGPFALTRNPMLAANFFGIMPGLCLLLNTNLGILGIGVSIFLFYRHIQWEEADLKDQFGDAYLAYQDRVARLVPYVFF